MNLLKSTGTFGFFTLISRILGYLRDIPNAIDLRGSVNYWKPVINMIDFSDYKVSIYNRHGELISFLDDINQFWDGKVLNSDLTVPMGVYVYQIEFKNPEGKYFHKKGHITLIK